MPLRLPPLPDNALPRRWRAAPRPQAIGMAALVVLGTTILTLLLHRHLSAASVPLVFLLAVLLASFRYGFWPGLLASGLAFMAANFFFVEPYFTLRVENPGDWLTLAVLLITGALTGFLVGRLREEAAAAHQRALVLDAIRAFAETLSQAATPAAILESLVGALSGLTGHGALCLEQRGETIAVLAARPAELALTPEDEAAADRALRRGTTEMPAAPGWSGGRLAFAPVSARCVVGYAMPLSRQDDVDAACHALIEQARVALDRLAKREEAAAASDMAQRESLRAALLSSLSHDLRTPLATILGGVSSLRELGSAMPESARQDTLAAVEEEAQRLSRYVGNLLNLTRLKAGLALRPDWTDIGDVVAGVINRAHRAFPGRTLLRNLPETVPLVHTDATLLEQVLFNLIDNALKFSPADRPVIVAVSALEGQHAIQIAVRDEGPGIPEDEQAHIFEPFFRGSTPETAGGTGLGLAIANGIAQALGGQLGVQSARGTGTIMTLTLPVTERPAR